ncbi:MAG TPA: AraC family transcriptional regulator [Fluviicoccus sp.]|nr:AraC family transcriptional regulator [Fluviicoccus sp.]
MNTPAPTEPGDWISARHLRHILARGEALGVDMAPVLAAGGLSRADLADADAMVPMAAVEAMLGVWFAGGGNPLPGLKLAATVQPPTFGALGLVFQSCATLADALQTMIRFNGLLTSFGETRLEFAPGTVRVCWCCAAGGEQFRRQAAEYVLGIFVTVARLLLEDSDRDLLRTVEFRHAAPANAALLREYFAVFGAPVHFDRPETALVLPADALKRPLRHGDVVLKALLEQQADSLLRRRPRPGSITTAVRTLVTAMLPEGLPAKEAVAAQLGLSAKTLQRRLDEAGTTFQALLDAVRLEEARRLLADPALPLTELPDRLGFATYPAFVRWFKRLAGQTPGACRAALSPDSGDTPP